MAWQQLNTSDEVAFGWQDLYQLDFLAHLPSLDFISDRNRNISTTQTFIHCILRYSDMDKDTISKPSSFWGRQWYVLKDQIDFWAAGKRAISILLFLNWKKSIMISRKSWTIFANNAELSKISIIYKWYLL